MAKKTLSQQGQRAKRSLKQFQIDAMSMYVLGSFETGVTVLSQQRRALSLAWALIQSQIVPTIYGSRTRPPRIAIIGGGFGGLTLAAGLMRKGCSSPITIFEKLDTLIPLQHGSDARWLHPHIYDWPTSQSENSSAELSVMHWTAARASDVVVELIQSWSAEAKSYFRNTKNRPRIYCNTHHLRVAPTIGGRFDVEWSGERRSSTNTTHTLLGASGNREDFDIVILALGFGLEKNDAHSYWRNETFAQPSLGAPLTSYIVSGQGDGALIDLLRLRISEFRQDRILSELFGNADELVVELRQLQSERDPKKMVTRLEAIFDPALKPAQRVLTGLRRRMRHDTAVILHTKVERVSDIVGSSSIKTSFQNKVLVFLLHRCGGFLLSNEPIEKIRSMFAVAAINVISRHGPDKVTLFKRVLSEEILKAAFIVKSVDGQEQLHLRRKRSQLAQILWPGGFFGEMGTAEEAEELSDDSRRTWRKEYLPSPTRLLCAAFCAGVAGFLASGHPPERRLRVTFHRAIAIAGENLLQQCCDYDGAWLSVKELDTGGRTFPAETGTIGAAWRLGRIVRSRKRVERGQLNSAMLALKLNVASRAMSPRVGFVLAIPLLCPTESGGAYVVGVLYVDSEASGYFVDDPGVSQLALMCDRFLQSCAEVGIARLGRIANFPASLQPVSFSASGSHLPPEVEFVAQDAPTAFDLSVSSINFEYSDFVAI